MKKKNIVALMALCLGLGIASTTFSATAAEKRKSGLMKQQGEWRKGRHQEFWNKLDALVNQLTDLKNDATVAQAREDLKNIITFKKEKLNKWRQNPKNAKKASTKLPRVLQKLTDALAALELNTPEGKERAKQILTDLQMKHTERLENRQTMKHRGGKKGRNAGWRGGKNRQQMQRKRPGTSKPRMLPMQSQQPVQPIGRMGQEGIIQPVPGQFAPSAPAAEEPGLVSKTQWLETPKPE